ncbi:hypothetical protein COW36_11635 [bacterium (Candidatus Blackallbacteria) CG17_big_fil_post_rev_8_21_14_2_50_48_46]|uniref:Uncharacterized protein n=1 Tax=bacterium (Candidatus Blackallbacteria) CG17_big_fil_post_rev_8_21_14_2_50_48_46 TaxID=2014261 RepID=A0A2M7G4Q4_9BACT|nr:MAG: hypothetical protein COW64_07070 [bacterium (Candidatus Blackallbacteria) CG18_big_fil_WC_8_21_14_2_50_49_26]PIW16745.1 MAG: hypothetical protein COW36_11635 [bacterium (Candidatus Blackallbacteria) CG17_big_fil_post_rev_8_21_14_2_50_48_46]PIW51170.1 MAG: hypothetical protein COW20_00055 [bacterium (Candidatus Blackallbacteria) CG13_big_fil_rev_8_21_14_2_50_49_14]
MNKFHVIIRIFIKKVTLDEIDVVSTLNVLLGSKIEQFSTEIYHNDSNYVIFSGLSPIFETSPNNALSIIANKLGKGWIFTLGDSEQDFSGDAIWNPTDQNSFVFSDVLFANLGIYHKD